MSFEYVGATAREKIDNRLKELNQQIGLSNAFNFAKEVKDKTISGVKSAVDSFGKKFKKFEENREKFLEPKPIGERNVLGLGIGLRDVAREFRDVMSPKTEDIYNKEEFDKRGVGLTKYGSSAFKNPKTGEVSFVDTVGAVGNIKDVAKEGLDEAGKIMLKNIKNINLGGEVSQKSEKAFQGFSDLTTKFLNYAKGKTTLSKQEILDFAKRPELKKGEANLLLKKIEEFKPIFAKAQELTQTLRGTKGMTADQITQKYPDIVLKREVLAKDIYGNKVKIPEGEALTPYELKGNKVLLQDGETYIVSKNQYQNIKGNAISGEAKPFAPELKGTEDVIKGEGKLTANNIVDTSEHTDNLGGKHWKITYDTGQAFIAPEGTSRVEAIRMASETTMKGKGISTKFSQYQLPEGPLSRDTEILTQKGWKRIDEVKIGDVALTRVDKDGLLEWNKIEAIPNVFAPILYHFKSQTIDMQVTPEHKMVVKRYRRSSQGIFRVTAKKLWKMAECVIPITGINNNIKPTKLFGLNAEDVAEFFGWYIAEGYSKFDNGKKNTIVIAQSIEANPEKCERLEALFDRLGFSWKYYGNAYGIEVREMSKAIREEIYKQPKSDAKFIPTFFFTQPKNVIEKLLEGLVLGDGITTKSVSRKDSTYYFTKSKQLAGDVQALTVLVNKKATVTQRKTGLYVVHFGYKQWASIDGAKHEIVDYNDYAYCVTVKNHAIYVRRNGLAGFTGNSNYKEVLIKAPEISLEKMTKLPSDYKISGNGNYWDVRNANGEHIASGNSKENAITNALSVENIGNKMHDTTNFKSSHWDEPNVISHLRLNERTYNGKKVTFMEELQSDWAKEGRQKGFANDPEYLKLRDEIKKYPVPKDEGDWNTIDLTDAGVPKDTVKKFYDLVFVQNKGGNVPNNPLLKNWQELSVKRALKKAVDNNSEYLAWTTGEQQVARYNLLLKDITHVKDVGGKIEAIAGGQKTTLNTAQETELRKLLGPRESELKNGIDLKQNPLTIDGQWARNLYGENLNGKERGHVKNIVEDLTGGKVEVLDMGLPIDAKVVSFDLLKDSSGARVGKLTPENLKIGAIISNSSGNYYIVTDILGDGKFKAVPKDIWNIKKLSSEDLQQQIDAGFDFNKNKQTFDISTKKSAGQQAIKITPEIKALVKGEAKKLPSASGKMFDDTNLNSQTSKLPAQEFADSIRRNLLELKPVKVKEPEYKTASIDQHNYNIGKTTLLDKRTGKNYEEVVFESPITTNGSSHYPNSKNYFAHARGDEIIESGKKVWREQEIQSDLLQKDNLESLKLRYPARPIENTGNELATGRFGNTKVQPLGTKEKEFGQLTPFTNDRFGERIMRERIREKAAKGYEKYRLPTGETIGKIEGFENPVWTTVVDKHLTDITLQNIKTGQEITRGAGYYLFDKWIITDVLDNGRFKAISKREYESVKNMGGSKRFVENNLIKESETFDLTGKSNPQYIRYKNWGKFLKNKFGGKEVIDPQGNTWMEVDLKSEYKKMPVEAFGKASLGSILGIGIPTAIAASIPAVYNTKQYSQDISNIKIPDSRELLPGETEYNIKTGEIKVKPLIGNKSSILTVYHPTKEQTDATPDKGGFLAKMEFGDVAVGNRVEYNKARSKFFKDKTDTFIFIPELQNISTPYGNGIFRVRDTMSLRYDKKNRLDIFIPTTGSNIEKQIRNTPIASYSYL